MEIRTEQFIGFDYSKHGTQTFQAEEASTGTLLPTAFFEATLAEVDKAAELAELAFDQYRNTSLSQRAQFLNQVADSIEAIGIDLIQRAMQETGLPEARLLGERGRTCQQLRLFAKVLEEGSFLEVRIDTALPERTPLPRPDIRMMNLALGPVVVFGASNFPLAFSVAGGDTASALAAGCPVIVKAHPAHPGTSALIAQAIRQAVQACNLPEGVFSMLHEKSGFQIAQGLVKHPSVKAVGFTGSLRGGRALFDIACSRPDPIPVYAEMGSVNPVFILPKTLNDNYATIAQGWIQSLALGVGQFCTNPGVVVSPKTQTTDAFLQVAETHIQDIAPGVMLHRGILNAYHQGTDALNHHEGTTKIAQSAQSEDRASTMVFKANGDAFLKFPDLAEEVFGPSALFVEAHSKAQLMDIANSLEGHLTATIWGTEEELAEYQALVTILEKKVGRLIFNGYPTGVEVCDAMVHGGPYPATTDSRTTSVGTAAIKRFLRPISYQNYPQSALPEALKNKNSLNLMRMVNGTLQRGDIES